mgnify:CR=1 FL=1
MPAGENMQSLHLEVAALVPCCPCRAVPPLPRPADHPNTIYPPPFQVGYLLTRLLADHPGMNVPVVREIERFMFRWGGRAHGPFCWDDARDAAHIHAAVSVLIECTTVFGVQVGGGRAHRGPRAQALRFGTRADQAQHCSGAASPARPPVPQAAACLLPPHRPVPPPSPHRNRAGPGCRSAPATTLWCTSTRWCSPTSSRRRRPTCRVGLNEGGGGRSAKEGGSWLSRSGSGRVGGCCKHAAWAPARAPGALRGARRAPPSEPAALFPAQHLMQFSSPSFQRTPCRRQPGQAPHRPLLHHVQNDQRRQDRHAGDGEGRGARRGAARQSCAHTCLGVRAARVRAAPAHAAAPPVLPPPPLCSSARRRRMKRPYSHAIPIL